MQQRQQQQPHHPQQPLHPQQPQPQQPPQQTPPPSAERGVASASAAEGLPAEATPQQKKTQRRSATFDPEIIAAHELREEQAREEARQPEPWAQYRQMRLPPKRPEDNWDISDAESAEDPQERDRSHKHVPRWCENHPEGHPKAGMPKYLDLLEEQALVDPDTIFSSRVPQCILEHIFPDTLYRRVNRERPKRFRGSSGDWRRDKLTAQEVHDYKALMGQMQSWNELKAAAAEKSGC